MIDILTFPILIYIKPSRKEKLIAIIFTGFCFIPFVFGIFMQEFIYCWSLFIGLFGAAIFQNFTSFKVKSGFLIQKNKSISFYENQIKITENNSSESYNWENLQEIHINIIAYKNKHEDEDRYFDGTENYITFTLNDEKKKVQFFVDKQKEFGFLSEFFERIILPKLYALKNIKQDSLIISTLDYTNLQRFKSKHNINRYTDFIYFN